MSYSSANRLRLENAAEDGSRRAKTAVGILDHFDRTLSAILIGNNLVNIAASSLGSVIVILLAGEQWTWVSTVVLTLLVIIFGETMPKIVAKQNANGIALRNAYAIRALSVILYPVIWLVVGLVHLITRPLHGDTGDGDPEEAASQELQSIIETAEDEDVLDEDRSELLRSALDFSDISASEAMTARVDMVAIDIDDDWDEIVRIINDSSYSRLPVYSGSVDNIIGFLYLNRFFKAMMDGRPDDLRAQLIPPCFVYKTTRLPDVLAKLRREQKHLAVVTDEFGGTLGVITMEDVLEELVGDIWDETDEVENEVVARPDGGYELDGAMTLSDGTKTSPSRSSPWTAAASSACSCSPTRPRTRTNNAIWSEHPACAIFARAGFLLSCVRHLVPEVGKFAQTAQDVAVCIRNPLVCESFCTGTSIKFHFSLEICMNCRYNERILNLFKRKISKRREPTMKFNKIVALALALVMVFALCACGGGTDTKNPDDSGSTAKVDTNTVSVGAVVIARDDVPTDEIYAFVSTIFENLDAITAQHAKGAELSIEAAASVKGVPYHPGAAKYFEEKGVKVDAVKEGAGNGTASALSFGTGGESGTYYAFGGVLASFVSGKSDCKVTALTSGGSQANVEDLTNGNVQLAFVQSDVMNYAYNGQRLFDSPVTGFSVVAQLYQEQVQIVTTNPDIKTVADLAGKKVSIGAAGSGVYFNAIDVLNAYDLKESDISAVYQSFGDSAESLKDGKIDAAFIVAGAPTTAITDLATAGSVYLVSLDDSHVQSLLAASPYYTAATIKAGTY